MSERRYLSQTDTLMWTVEADPLLRSTIVGVVLLDGAPEWDRFERRVRYAIEQIPAFRQRIRAVPRRSSTLRWEDVEHVELDHHLRRVGAPGKGTVDDVLAMAASIGGTPFDPVRPLWELTLVEHLDDGSSALILKAHHVVTDGLGAVQLIGNLFDFEADAAEKLPTSTPPTAPSERSPSALESLGRSVGEIVESDVRRASAVLRQLPALLGAATRSMFSQEAAAEVIETARSIGRVVAPVRQTKSAVMTERSLGSVYLTIDTPLSVLHDAAHVAGGTLNDAFLAGITGGLRRFHDAHGQLIDELRVAMPVSLRTSDDEVGGNHITVLRFLVPVAETDPAARIAALHAVAGAQRDERSLAHTASIAGVLNLMPAGVVGSMLKKVDFLASNVPGVPVPMYLAGVAVNRFFPFGPTAGASLNVTLMSYNGTCCIGVHVDPAAVTDPGLLHRHLQDSFAEVAALARKRRTGRRVRSMDDR